MSSERAEPGMKILKVILEMGSYTPKHSNVKSSTLVNGGMWIRT